MNGMLDSEDQREDREQERSDQHRHDEQQTDGLKFALMFDIVDHVRSPKSPVGMHHFTSRTS